MTTFELIGRSLLVDGVVCQIAQDDTLYCPECGEQMLYWQLENHLTRCEPPCQEPMPENIGYAHGHFTGQPSPAYHSEGATYWECACDLPHDCEAITNGYL